MQQPKKLNIPVNPYFFYPFIAWVVGGGILLAVYSKQDLFVAINGHHTAFTDTLMYWITFMGQAEVIIPVLLLMMIMSPFRNWWYFIAAVACNVTPFIVQQLVKKWFDAPRPLNYFNHAQWIHIDPKWPELMNFSFPSGHSAGAFSFFCFLSLLLPKTYNRFGLLFFILALSVAYSRIYLAAHFFADVYVGSIFGAVITLAAYAVMSKVQKQFD